MHDWLTSSLDSASEGHPVWVAEVEGRVVGVMTADARDHWSGERDAYVGELVVHEDHVGHGIGGALMARAEDGARGRGFDRLRLETEGANETARAFYATRGYVTEKVRPDQTAVSDTPLKRDQPPPPTPLAPDIGLPPV